MARKKEYSVNDANPKKRPQQLSPPNEPKNKHDNSGWKGKQTKRREQVSPAGSSAKDVYDVADLRAQLGSYGLTLRDIPGDGNCLFRALGDQLEGHSMNHLKHRMDTVRYMIAHRGHFEPFIDVPFDRYVDNLSRAGTYAGQDALVAFARLHKVNIVIHQLNSPLWQIEGCEEEGVPELHLSYHNGEHYSSVRRFGDFANTPPHIRILSHLTRTAEVPCCASHGSICTSSVPVTSHVANFGGNQESSYVNSSMLSSPKLVAAPKSLPLDNAEHGYTQNEDDFSVLVQEAMLRSGCRDKAMATEALIDNSCDLEQTVDYLMSLTIILDGNQEDVEGCDTERSKELISDVATRRRILDRRSVDDDRVERLRSSCRLGSLSISDSKRVIGAASHEKKARKPSSCVAKGPDQKRDVEVEKDLRFLTL